MRAGILGTLTWEKSPTELIYNCPELFLAMSVYWAEHRLPRRQEMDLHGVWLTVINIHRRTMDCIAKLRWVEGGVGNLSQEGQMWLSRILFLTFWTLTQPHDPPGPCPLLFLLNTHQVKK